MMDMFRDMYYQLKEMRPRTVRAARARAFGTRARAAPCASASVRAPWAHARRPGDCAQCAAREQMAHQVLNLCMIVCSALMIWKSLMVLTESESPVVVVLSGAPRARAWQPAQRSRGGARACERAEDVSANGGARMRA
jgi:hypothetical protein